VFIKSGAGGSIRGAENKYLSMAKIAHEKLGATVICANNPDVSHEFWDEKIIRWVISKKEFSKFELYFFGTSDGAYKNLLLAKKFPETVKIISVNTSFISLENLTKELLAIPQVKKILVCGTNDDEYDALISLKNEKCNNLSLVTIEGANHIFSGMTDKYISLIELL
jgi:alpha/beta superfamily hydrolase